MHTFLEKGTIEDEKKQNKKTNSHEILKNFRTMTQLILSKIVIFIIFLTKNKSFFLLQGWVSQCFSYPH